MSKLTKLLRSPQAFLGDALDKRFPKRRMAARIAEAQASGKPTAILVGFSDWKSWMRDVLPDQHVVFLGHNPNVALEMLETIPHFPNPHVYVWSYKFPPALRGICAAHTIPLTFVEDAFVRGFGLGVNRTRPMSLAFDTHGMHFDRNVVSDLDRTLNMEGTYDESVLEGARRVMARMREGMTKYMGTDGPRDLAKALHLDPDRRTLLVLGQVEDDLSIAYGMDGFMTGNELVMRVALDNPDAQILYRPHPESLQVAKKHYSNPQDVAHIAHIVGPEWSLHDTFAAAQEAHAITSLAGLEAAVADLDVHTYGAPFYAGWGFTTDHGFHAVPGKRKRARTLEEVVAAAYLLYPRYYHPSTTQEISPQTAFDLVATMRAHTRRVAQARAQQEAPSQGAS